MSDLLRVKRGLKANLPELMQGELGYCTDTKELYVGGTNGNVKVGDVSQHGALKPADGVHGITTTGALTYYVNTATGNDTNDGLTSGTAFKTIMKAINSAPKLLSHALTINVADGTYNETVIVYGFFGEGSVTINGNASTPTNVVVNAIDIQKCSTSVSATGIASNTTTTNGISVSRCKGFTFTSCVATGTTGVYSGASVNFSEGRFITCTFSNKLYGIKSSMCSQVTSENNTGTGNTVGICGSSGLLMKAGTQPAGATAEIQEGGGVIR